VQLVDEFMANYGLSYPDIEVVWMNYSRRYAITNPILRKAWLDFHLVSTNLRYVSKEGNASEGDRGYSKRKRELGDPVVVPDLRLRSKITRYFPLPAPAAPVEQ
jgi:hypothetical protein